METIKIVTIGDEKVGKTCMLESFINHKFPEAYKPTIYESYSIPVTFRGNPIDLKIGDTAGQANYSLLIPLTFQDADVGIVCFSVVDRVSYQNVKNKWIPELRKYSPKAQIILVGTKIDLRHTKETISFLEGILLGKEIKAHRYIECSAWTRDSLDEVIAECIWAKLKPVTTSKMWYSRLWNCVQK